MSPNPEKVVSLEQLQKTRQEFPNKEKFVWDRILEAYVNEYRVRYEACLEQWKEKFDREFVAFKKQLQDFCNDVATVFAGLSWFDVKEEQERCNKFIEETFPHFWEEREEKRRKESSGKPQP